MNDTQAEEMIRLLTGIWPQPMKPEEAVVWARVFKTCGDEQAAAQVIDGLFAQGNRYRPTASEFRAAYIAATRLKQLGAPPAGLPELEAPPERLWDDESHLPRPRGDRVASPEFNAVWSAHVKAKLASMTGPFSRNLADAVESQRRERAPERKRIMEAVESIKEEGWKA